MRLQTPSRRLIDIYLVLSVVLCLIFIHHGKLLHVKCQPLDFDSSELCAARTSQTAPAAPASSPPAFLEKPLPVSVRCPGSAAWWGPPAPRGPDPRCLQPGVLCGVLVNVGNRRGGKAGESLLSVADARTQDCASF